VPTSPFSAKHGDRANDYGSQTKQNMEADGRKEDRVTGRDWVSQNNR